MSKITEYVGHRIRDSRKRKGFTIEEFSKMINKSKATLSKYENGSIAIDIDTLLDISEALEMELTHLINYKSPKLNKPTVLRNSYFDHSQYYMYFYDGRYKKLIKSVLYLSQRHDNSNRADAILYKGVEQFSKKENCENIYNGTLESFDATSHATLINQINKSEKIHLLLMNPMQRSIPAIGLLTGIGNPPIFSPLAIKTIVSRYILKENEAFEQVINISKDELKQIRKYNMMLVGSENYQILDIK